MAGLTTLDKNRLESLHTELKNEYEAFKARGLKLDMTRGKPCAEQLDLSRGMLTCIDETDVYAADGTDCRNYGGLDGIAEVKALFAAYLTVDATKVIIGGNSSLNLMHDTLMRAMLNGVESTQPPWGSYEKIKFLCPSPGYDRHFAICEYLGIEMIPVTMDDNGPDMDQVERVVAGDDTIKGIWCVPRYSNPTGIVYSDQVVERLAAMRTKAADFRILCDNAYAEHHLTGNPRALKNILDACQKAGNPDRVIIFASTSKISFAGSGIAVMAASRNNVAFIKKQMEFQTIGPDKLNQLRHIRFFKDMDGIRRHMRKHAEILKPKFDAVLGVLDERLSNWGVATWSRPEGGYFISIDTPKGCAKKVVGLADEAGVKFTPAGATFPYGMDPEDQNIRIAPSFAALEDIGTATQLMSICILLAAVESKM
ncbi:MAG: aminotransferase class I/II-fold pyridoxal phosphate-dependent enzyme [Desulfobacteraceae bacterium]|nr:aminotransferase class I/II-fold pyridoxal phosphate-dependent enzyme [Desulfobacteraceae bacterium]